MNLSYDDIKKMKKTNKILTDLLGRKLRNKLSFLLTNKVSNSNWSSNMKIENKNIAYIMILKTLPKFVDMDSNLLLQLLKKS